jgi:hypothetical protein
MINMCLVPPQFALEFRGFFTEWKWVWIGIGVELGYSFLLIYLQVLALTYLGRECCHSSFL